MAEHDEQHPPQASAPRAGAITTTFLRDELTRLRQELRDEAADIRQEFRADVTRIDQAAGGHAATLKDHQERIERLEASVAAYDDLKADILRIEALVVDLTAWQKQKADAEDHARAEAEIAAVEKATALRLQREADLRRQQKRDNTLRGAIPLLFSIILLFGGAQVQHLNGPVGAGISILAVVGAVSFYIYIQFHDAPPPPPPAVTTAVLPPPTPQAKGGS